MNTSMRSQRTAVTTMGMLGGVLVATVFSACCAFLLLLGIVHVLGTAPMVVSALSAVGLPTNALVELPSIGVVTIAAAGVVALLAWRFVHLTLPAHTSALPNPHIIDFTPRLQLPAVGRFQLLFYGIAALLLMALCELLALFASLFLLRSVFVTGNSFHWLFLLGPIALVCSCSLFLYTLHTFRLYFGKSATWKTEA